jgi:hypothetical protein
LGAGGLYLTRSAKTADVQTSARSQSVPGIGQILALVLLYEIQAIPRVPRVQDFGSYCRLVKCATESNGNRLGTAGKKLGNVSAHAGPLPKRPCCSSARVSRGRRTALNSNTDTAKPQR